eukprot:61735_1
MTSSESHQSQSKTEDNSPNIAKAVQPSNRGDMDYKLEYLQQLLHQSEHQIFLQLLWKIINDILTNKNNNKWKKVQLTEIEEKLSKRGCILLFHVLMNSHFNLSNDGTTLIFNQNKILQLQQINKLLLTENIHYKQIDEKLKNIENIITQQRKLFVSNQNEKTEEK